jgi:hypothetical protein
MGHSAPDHEMQWHARSEDLLESAESRAARQSRYDGERMKLIFSGPQDEGTRQKNIDQKTMSKYDQDRRWRGQERDETGRTTIAKTVENGYFKEIPRCITPMSMRSKRFSDNNLRMIRVNSEKNRQIHPKYTPLNNDDLLSVRILLIVIFVRISQILM